MSIDFGLGRYTLNDAFVYRHGNHKWCTVTFSFVSTLGVNSFSRKRSRL